MALALKRDWLSGGWVPEAGGIGKFLPTIASPRGKHNNTVTSQVRAYIDGAAKSAVRFGDAGIPPLQCAAC